MICDYKDIFLSVSFKDQGKECCIKSVSYDTGTQLVAESGTDYFEKLKGIKCSKSKQFINEDPSSRPNICTHKKEHISDKTIIDTCKLQIDNNECLTDLGCQWNPKYELKFVDGLQDGYIGHQIGN